MRHITDEEMFRLADGECTPEEQQLFKTHLDNCQGCKALHSEITSLNNHLQQLIQVSPSAAFTDTVMKKWQTAPALQQPVFYTRRYSLVLAPLFVVASLILVVLSMVTLGWFSHTALPAPENRFQMSHNLGGLQKLLENETMMGVFFIINAILALLIVDKLVLQPYFRKRMDQLAG